MHHAVSPVQPVHWVVERQDEDPAVARITSIVEERIEDETCVVLRLCHDSKHNRPGNASSDSPERTKQI